MIQIEELAAPEAAQGELIDAQSMLHLFERDTLGLWIEEQHDDELQGSHGREENKRRAVRTRSE
jgi:hypothetical protein